MPDMLDCQGKCEDSCRSPFEAMDHEARRILQRTGRPLVPGDGCRGCSHLTPLGRCSVYDIRPFVCRLFGTTPTVRCEHGCQPVKWLTDGEALVLVAEIENLYGADHDIPALLALNRKDPGHATRIMLALRVADGSVTVSPAWKATKAVIR